MKTEFTEELKEKLIEDLKKRLKPSRFNHTLGVRDTAVILAERFGADAEKAEETALFHDYAKYEPDEKMLALIDSEIKKGLNVSPAYIKRPNLYHGQLAAKEANELYGVEDEEVLSAIECHTAGKKDMTLLEKIIYLADMIEPGRDFDGIKDIREAAENNINIAMLLALKSSMRFILQKGDFLIADTVEAYNSILAEESEKGSCYGNL